MSTPVTILVVHAESDGADVQASIERAFGWFREIESRCTRFNPRSELMQLGPHPVAVSPILYEAVRFALLVAEETGGAFDPTVGQRMEQRGFNKEHRTGETVRSATAASDDVSYRDVDLDARTRTVTLRRPLTLDLGAVAKGLAVDTAARELLPFRNFSIDAGGDLYLGGTNAEAEAWTVGIRHPRRAGELIEVLRVSDEAVCTSGDYEKPGHIIGGEGELASATVVASGAMLADALATAAFVLGPKNGLQLLERMGVEGLLVTPDLASHRTRGLRRAA